MGRVVKLVGLILGIALIMLVCTGANYSEKQHEYSEIFANATDKDYEALEQVVFNEAGNCDDWRLRLAVVETICNRVLDPNFPSTIYDVCHQKGQFACRKFKTDDYTYEGVCDAIEMVLHEGRTVLPSVDYVYFAIGKQSIAKDHIYLGDSRKWQHMWFGKAK